MHRGCAGLYGAPRLPALLLPLRSPPVSSAALSIPFVDRRPDLRRPTAAHVPAVPGQWALSVRVRCVFAK
ncbi:UV radiation resistance protein [Histoplasma capsulatum G186AR]|uniref:UV radiation resistance protein n=1 Tax=Ajellomyces capsulatus TaxID=5037 RepID=A0A8H7YW08_AJECA|nr:UV radiation resistance protein [Histoplasma capsulatum]QSS73064.1 UV radiation resistance protein [Histoplasma capsulatum G186AR]